MKRFLKKIARSALRRFNLRLVRIGPAESPKLGSKRELTAYEAAVIALASVNPKIRIVVVGANDGKHGDPVYAVVRDFLATRTQMVLIEPQQRLHNYIAEHYDFHDDVQILRCAVGPGETLELNAIRPEFWTHFQPSYAKGWPGYRAPTGITSTDRQKVLNWVRKYGHSIVDPEAAVETFEVPSRSLADALTEAELAPIADVLQVDAEGFDDVVVYNSDLAQTRPRIVRFESVHLSSDRRIKLTAHLEALGYLLTPSGADTLAICLDPPIPTLGNQPTPEGTPDL